MLILPSPRSGSGNGGHVTWNDKLGGYYLDFRWLRLRQAASVAHYNGCVMHRMPPAACSFARAHMEHKLLLLTSSSRTVSVFFTNVALLISKLTKVPRRLPPRAPTSCCAFVSCSSRMASRLRAAHPRFAAGHHVAARGLPRQKGRHLFHSPYGDNNRSFRASPCLLLT
jgi:hypothetical protein